MQQGGVQGWLRSFWGGKRRRVFRRLQKREEIWSWNRTVLHWREVTVAQIIFENIKVRFVGEYVDDLQEGSGTAYYSSGAVKYVGEWSRGSPHGNGTYIALNGDRWDCPIVLYCDTWGNRTKLMWHFSLIFYQVCGWVSERCGGWSRDSLRDEWQYQVNWPALPEYFKVREPLEANF